MKLEIHEYQEFLDGEEASLNIVYFESLLFLKGLLDCE